MAEVLTKVSFTATLAFAILIPVATRASDVVPSTQQLAQSDESDRIAEQDTEPSARPTSRYRDDVRDAVDAAAPIDSKTVRLLQQAETLLADRKWDRAIDVLLFTLDRAGHSLIQRQDGSLVSVAAEANDLLGQLPDSMMAAYRREYGPAASKALADAVQVNDRQAIERIATQFRHTDAGREAILRIALDHFDRGEFGLAAVVFRRLDIAHLAPSMRIRAAYACTASGQDDKAAQYLASLSDDERRTLPIGRSIDDLMSDARQQRRALPIAENWLLPRGNAAGTLVAPQGDPVLLQRWSHPLTERPQLQRQIEHTERELRDGNLAGIPASVPLAVGDRVVSRTSRGLAVRSLVDGQLLWESADDDSIEPQNRISGRNARPRVVRVPFQFGPNPSSGIRESRSMMSVLYRNGSRGFLTSDGRRVYAVEELTDTVANRIVAFDLATGRPAWSEYGALGGLISGGPFVSPLAGYTFLGPPTPVGDDLFVVGERDKEISLIAINPETGTVKWERLVANAQTGIDQDPVRRDWPAPVASAEGVLVCSTTVGWVMGIDRNSQSILWAYRLSAPQPNRQQQEGNAAPATGLNERWCPSAPIIVDGRVYLTPPEEPRLVCLDLFTGELVWQKAKGKSLYVAGLASDRLIMVGLDSVTAVDPANGSTAWSLPISEESGLPSGRAVLTRDHICLPFDDRSLWIIDAEDGELLARKHRSADEPALGNLVLHRGTLLSLSASELTAFEERAQLLSETQERLKQDPQDAAAILRLAELDHADGRPAMAWKRLSQIDVADLDSPQTNRFRRFRWNVLETLTRSAVDSDFDPLAQMAEVAATAEERLTVRRLEADRASAAGDSIQALRAYRSLIENVPADAVVKEDGGRREVRLTEWLAGRLLELHRSTKGEKRTDFDREIRDCLNAAITSAEQDRVTTIFAFHPAAAAMMLGLAETALASGRHAEAELRFLRLRHHSDPAIASAARDGLAATAGQYALSGDEAYWNSLPGPGSDARSPIEAPRPSARVAATELPKEVAGSGGFEWGDFRLTTMRSGSYTSSETVIDIAPEGAELPYFRNRSLRLHGRKGNLAVSGPSGIGLEYSIPLPMDGRSARQVTALAEGHVIFLLLNSTVQVISPVEGRVLWTAEVPGRSGQAFSGDEAPRPMRPAGGLSGTFGLIARSRTREALPIANASYVALRGRGELVVLDSLTGDVRWSRNDLPHDATVIGTDSVIYVLPRRNADGRVAYLAIDGRKFPMGRAGEHTLPHAVASIGDRLLTVIAESPPFRLFNLPIGRRSVVALHDPRTNRATWSHSFPADTLFDMTLDGRLCALNAGGELFEIQAETGVMKRLGTIPAEVLRGRNEAYLLSDRVATYLIVNSGGGQRFFAAETPAIPVNGHVFAFDREEGRLLWQREVTNRRLLCQEFDHQPVLLMIDSDRTNKGGQGLWQLNLLAWDKRSGKTVLDEPYYTTSTPYFHAVTVQPDRRTIDLSAYNMRVRLQAAASTEDRHSSSSQPPAGSAEASRP